MHSFTPTQLTISIPISLSWLLGRVMEAKGREEALLSLRPETLEGMRETAVVQSVESSNRIEGVTVAPERLVPLVRGETRPADRSEEEIVGYRKALDLVHAEHASLEVTPETMKRLHLLAQGGFSGDAGQFKQKPVDIIEILPDGRRVVRFRTVGPEETPEVAEQLCLAYEDTINQDRLPPLLAAGSFVFDFLCIHPFRDGNGRVSRLLTLLLLYKQGYNVGRYVSLERIVEETKGEYYEALKKSSEDWHEARHDITPWWSYFLGMVNNAYRELEERG